MTDVATWADDAWRRGLAPEPPLTVSAWADAQRMLPDTASEPGPWRTDRTPYLRDVMDALSPSSPVERVVFMKGAQLGATEAGLNWLGYVIAHAPGLMLSVMPTTEAARRNVRTRVDPLIESTPAVRERVTKAKSRDPGNTATLKSFAGGQIAFVGANSAVGLRSTPARYLFLDEVDGYPHDADGEGDPVALAIQRTVTFRGRRKIFMVSTPTIEGASRISKAYAESDQRLFFVPCPICGAYQSLRWPQVRWDGDHRGGAWYQCAHCGDPIYERHKPRMLAQGEWRVTAAGDGRTAGFHLSALYSPFETWAEIAVEHGAVYRDPPRLQTWVNLKLGEPYEDRAAQIPEPARLMVRAESWGADVPDDVVVITAGVDVQQDRLECEIVGWGKGEESWSLEYHTLAGNPADGDVWTRLDVLLMAARRRRDGRMMHVMGAAVDTGNWSKLVYDFVTPRHSRRVWAIKGSSTAGAPIWPRRPSRPKPGRPPLYVVGVDAAKEVVMARLALDEPGPGFSHFPTDRDLDYFKMLTAERPIRRFVKGVAIREWKKAAFDRNEALDCRVYALAAFHGLRSYGLDLNREAERQAVIAEAAPSPAAPRVIRSKWMRR
ncbi:phage terminase large subunit family protein [Bradyrhizobium elkanii]|uniref:Phage terminase large subunit family protein n=1 Tax=Bradyrhizobium elkanii TaxID=29448 RepID=A0A4U6RHA9_BRAEL|nr:phage terminase large subunit family protein [Bradyrhizobium elkanii]TKV73291.1 phage terminase large subunit family protein [Bradyrhizobium elkanii]